MRGVGTEPCRGTSSAQYGHTLHPSLSCLLHRGQSLLNCVLQCGQSTYCESIGSPQLGQGRSSRAGPPGSESACVSSSSARRSAIVSGGRVVMEMDNPQMGRTNHQPAAD